MAMAMGNPFSCFLSCPLNSLGLLILKPPLGPPAYGIVITNASLAPRNCLHTPTWEHGNMHMLLLLLLLPLLQLLRVSNPLLDDNTLLRLMLMF